MRRTVQTGRGLPMDKNDTLRVAVIGGGNIAQKHLEVLRDLPGVELCALVDRDPEMLEETSARFEIHTRLGSHAELLAGGRPDAGRGAAGGRPEAGRWPRPAKKENNGNVHAT